MSMAGICLSGGISSWQAFVIQGAKVTWEAFVIQGAKVIRRQKSDSKSHMAKVTGGHFDTGGKIPAANVGGQKVKRQKAGGQMSLNLLK